jgi:DeoR family suf operon transcriptional repressor
LGLAAATVRRHLDVLQRDGHVERQAVRRSTGRPHYVFKLTQAGRDLAPGHYVGVTELLLSELLSLTRADTRGKDGTGVTLLAFERMNQALLRSCESRVTAPEMPERLDQTVEALAAGGMMLETEALQGGYVITVRDCPCHWAGSSREALCKRSEALLGRLLGRRLRRMATVSDICRYVTPA